MEGMTCPHCGVATGYDPVEYRKMVVMSRANFQVAELVSGSIYDSKSKQFFGVTRCQACGKAFPVKGEASNPEDPDKTVTQGTLTPLWPTRFRSVANEIPTPVREAMEDASAALGAGSVIGGMLASRTAMIRALSQQQQDLKLQEATLKALFEAGRISRFEFEASDLARRWANYFGHDDIDPTKTFDRSEAEEFYGYIEGLLDTLYVKWVKVEASRKKLKGEQAQNNTQPKA